MVLRLHIWCLTPANQLPERIPVPDLAQPYMSPRLLAENERTSLKRLLDQTTGSFSNGGAANAQAGVWGKGLNDLLDPDDLSEL